MEAEIMNLKKKKVLLDKLYYDVGKQNYDFFLAGTYEKNGEKLFTKWKKYSECIFPMDENGKSDDWKTQKFFEQINQRQILPIEIVLDVEEKEKIKPIVEKLEKWKWEYSIWETGSRGYHIHIIGNRVMTQEEKEGIAEKLGTDVQVSSDKHLIALENCPHWKGTGKIKKEIMKEQIMNDRKEN